MPNKVSRQSYTELTIINQVRLFHQTVPENNTEVCLCWCCLGRSASEFGLEIRLS
jgi:hypothetical protein